VQRAQRAWASGHGIAHSNDGYVADLDDNFRVPLADAVRRAFERGKGRELADAPGRPASMRALHSSAALVVNVFEYWRTAADRGPLVGALGLSGNVAGVEFEATFPTGLGGTPPHLDVALRFDDDTVVGIECKFTEWMAPKPSAPRSWPGSYFGVPCRWAERGLHKCRDLAERLDRGAEHFRHLDAPQLLKHGLGLAAAGRHFRLLYVYFDCSRRAAAGEAHRHEVARFAAACGDELGFRALSYQQLLAALAPTPGEPMDHYRRYLTDRYFPDAVDPEGGA
jgi:hypothetical protein